jgi:cytochrome c-type protein NapC
MRFTDPFQAIATRHLAALAAGLLALFALPGCLAASIDWSTVPEQQVVLFYPGQASWEWALTERDHSGAPKFREGRNCATCHKGEEADIGAKIVSGKILEPHPLEGKAGSLPLRIQTARDETNLYFRFRWTSPPPSGQKDDPKFAASVTVMLGDEAVREAPRAGCWSACHDDVRGMASATADDTRSKYLGASRSKLSRQGGGDNTKPDADLQKLLQDGAFLEYWQAKLNPGAEAVAASGYVLDQRHSHSEIRSSAEATQSGSEWTVVLSRPLVGGGAGHKDLVAGRKYAVGFALHEDFSDHRHHLVSLEYSLALDGEADFLATQR